MKQIKFTIFFLIGSLAFFSCKKEKIVTPPPITNSKPPVANAGPDISISLLSCRDKGTFTELDGTGSFHPDSNIVWYHWAAISGPPGSFFSNAALAKTTVYNLLPGKYKFELTVKDAGRLSSKDTVLIVVALKEYDLDITVTGNFSFIDNFYSSPWDYDMPGGYFDLTEITGRGIIPLLGEFEIYIAEYADTAVLNDNILQSYVLIFQGHTDPLYITAPCSINFKKLIRQGGGAFSGSFTVTSGSAEQCGTNVFTNLPPLTVTGNLDVNSHIVAFGIKGKVYF